MELVAQGCLGMRPAPRGKISAPRFGLRIHNVVHLCSRRACAVQWVRVFLLRKFLSVWGIRRRPENLNQDLGKLVDWQPVDVIP
ncbi:hypothetical protein GJ744_001050 [Endocarpon pusillum]|uniref:Uncharacterized protein n=1 Tax=Endocarpon pusillum TaxID=364733 RepID=A0A8H7E0X8_9EURO|nr:hypothetical protein GJ744_001050 [Endocarpon pusillum]